MVEGTPPGDAFCHPHSEQRRPARAHAVGPVLGPHARSDRTRDTRVAEPRLRAPEDRRPAEGQRLTPDAPHNGSRPPPPGMAPHRSHSTQPPQGIQAKGTVLGPHTHTPAPTARGWRTPTARSRGRAAGGGTAPETRRPSQWWKASPPETPFRHPHSEQRRPARAHAVELVLGPHAHSDRTRNTRVPVPRLPAPEDGRSGEGRRLTPDAAHNSGRPPPPPGDAPPPGRADKPGRAEPGPDCPPPSTPDGARDRGRTRGGARTTWNGPTSAQCRDRALCARHTTQGGGGSGRRGSASAHTRKGHLGTTRRATRPSSRNAQTA